MAEKGNIVELTALLKLHEHDAVQDKLEEMAVQDIAEAISGLEPEERIAAFRVLPRERQADTFSYLSLRLEYRKYKRPISRFPAVSRAARSLRLTPVAARRGRISPGSALS